MCFTKFYTNGKFFLIIPHIINKLLYMEGLQVHQQYGQEKGILLMPTETVLPVGSPLIPTGSLLHNFIPS
jgi:hypothetical protein